VTALRFGLALTALVCACAMAAPAPAAEPMLSLTPARRAQEAAFMRLVKRNQTANDMTADVPAHTGEHVAYTCSIEEIERPTVVVGQCGPEEEPVDLYLELPAGKWRTGQRIRVLGIMDHPGSWSDVSGHTIYYPFVKAVFVDRLR
jgi:membrane-bound lytic murein transglycosylase B